MANSKIVGQILWSGQLTVNNPRFHRQVYKIDGTNWGDEPDPFDEWVKKVRQTEEYMELIQGS